MDIQKEKELIKKAHKDESAFNQIYDEYYGKIFNYIVRRVATLEVAQDITSEVFFKAFRNLWQFQWRRISFSSWLYKIATNEIINHFRKNPGKNLSLDKLLEEKKFEAAQAENPNTDLIEAQERLEQHHDFLEIQSQIAKLPLHSQTIISLKFFEKKKIKEIAEILGKKEGTVKSLLSRGLEDLRKLLQEHPTLSQRIAKNSIVKNKIEPILGLENK